LTVPDELTVPEEAVADHEPIYKGYRDGYGPHFNVDDNPPLVVVVRGGESSPLPDLSPVGPAGYSWGYSGGGPYNLARSILADYLDCYPGDELTLALREKHIAPLDSSRGWEIPGSVVREFLVAHRHIMCLRNENEGEVDADGRADRALKRRFLGG